MGFDIIWHEKITDDLKGISRDTARKIIGRIKDYLATSPISLGKPLKGRFAGLYRYRYGDWRVIYSIDAASQTITILRISHRKDIYDK